MPAQLSARSTLGRSDYASAIAVSAARASAHSPEQWLRAVFEQAPAPLPLLLYIGWRGLGARLSPRSSAHHLLGWRIEASGADWIRISIRWRIGLKANIVLVTERSKVAIATFVVLQRPASRLVWRLLIPLHELLLCLLLSLAARRLGREPDPGR